MVEVYNSPELQFVVRAATPRGEELMFFVIEQAIPKVKGDRAKRSVRNQVERHLSDLSGRTGLQYQVIFEGDYTRRKAYCKQFGIEVS